jgi:hypothetical protein
MGCLWTQTTDNKSEAVRQAELKLHFPFPGSREGVFLSNPHPGSHSSKVRLTSEGIIKSVRQYCRHAYGSHDPKVLGYF